MVLKLALPIALALSCFGGIANASQSFLDLGFIVPPGYFSLGIESIQTSQKLTTPITIQAQTETTTTQGFLQVGLFTHADLKITAGQAKTKQTVAVTDISTGNTVEDIKNANGATDMDAVLSLRLIGNGDNNSFNVLTRLGYSPNMGEKEYATDTEDGNSRNGRSRYFGMLGLNVKFTNSDWLLSGEYVSNNEGHAANPDDSSPTKLGAYTTTNIELRYRLNFGRVIYFDIFGGKYTTSEIQNVNTDTNVTTTTSGISSNFMGGGLGFLINDQIKLEGQIRSGGYGLRPKVTQTSSTGTSTEFDVMKDQSIYMALSFIL